MFYVGILLTHQQMTNILKKYFGTTEYVLRSSSDDTEEDDSTPPNYIMVCHKCGKKITRERACKTTKQAKTGEIVWKECGHRMYFVRDAINGLRDVDLLEAVKHLDTGRINVEATEFERIEADANHVDEDDAHFFDITYWGFDEEQGHYPLNRGILSIGYTQSDTEDEKELISPRVESMLKDTNEKLESEDTDVSLLELSEP